MVDKRLFFGLETWAPWPMHLPAGKLIAAGGRHATLIFLGRVNWDVMRPLLIKMPLPHLALGTVATFDKILFLPRGHPNVVCWQLELFEAKAELFAYQKRVACWLKEQGLGREEPEKTWLPHVTLARAPFDFVAWRQNFEPLPAILSAVNLYESLGNSCYQILQSWPFSPPWRELERHTGSGQIVFEVVGSNLQQIYRHAQSALAFKFPPLVRDFLRAKPLRVPFQSLEEVTKQLNAQIASAEQQQRCPLTAVSLHGEAQPNGCQLQWEMIVEIGRE
jgi:2'-5' RNA ligase